ncbi:MAG: hypothetical protein C6I01_03915 [Epsilonproteobacteria bacterium]|jgi:uncharacterized repeat protein (TIGR01451 family)|nr:hypothetical protein [Campylobacterota bacterium]NPA89555.1 hypothetical protein [Campylobacterota bacterium]
MRKLLIGIPLLVGFLTANQQVAPDKNYLQWLLKQGEKQHLSGQDFSLDVKKFLIIPLGITQKVIPLPPNYKLKDGEMIEYHITARNLTPNKTFHNVEIKVTIPPNTQYVPDSAIPKEHLYFSIDGGKTFQKPPIYYWTYINGQKVKKVAPPSMYSNLKWVIPQLKPGDQLLFRLRITGRKKETK